MLPAEVMLQAQNEFLNFQGTGMSIMEVSHRSAIFQQVIDKAEADLRKLMSIPSDYKVLFLQGGASTQFAMIPLNLMRKGKAVFLDTGAWSQKAIAEASKYGQTHIVASSKDSNFSYVPSFEKEEIDQEADYLHLTQNNTIFGTRIHSLPVSGKVPLVSDMSSMLLSEEVRVEDYGLIYAGAQKNIGPSGLTIVILREDLIGYAQYSCPKMLNYQTHVDKASMFNTPPTFPIYMTGLVFAWTLKEGGVKAMEEKNMAKSSLLYEYLDQSDFYRPDIASPHRSRMNVCFHTPSPELDIALAKFADEEGCKFIKGHRSVGGIRASLYNAMSIEGVAYLIEILKQFKRRA